MESPEPVNALSQDLLDQGIKSIAVVLKHAAIYPDHEQLVGSIAREVGFSQVSLSSDVMQMVKMVPRGFTATADAYLTPHIVKYITPAIHFWYYSIVFCPMILVIV